MRGKEGEDVRGGGEGREERGRKRRGEEGKGGERGWGGSGMERKGNEERGRSRAREERLREGSERGSGLREIEGEERRGTATYSLLRGKDEKPLVNTEWKNKRENKR